MIVVKIINIKRQTLRKNKNNTTNTSPRRSLPTQRDLKCSESRRVTAGVVALHQGDTTKSKDILNSPFGKVWRATNKKPRFKAGFRVIKAGAYSWLICHTVTVPLTSLPTTRRGTPLGLSSALTKTRLSGARSPMTSSLVKPSVRSRLITYSAN